MKKIGMTLIIVAAIITFLGVISRLTLTPIMDLGPRALATLAGLLLLFAIALQGAKSSS